MDNNNIDQFSVLVVDDDPSFRTILKSIYSSAHYNVTTASDGKDASRILESYPIDLVITDIQMPNVDGIELAKIIHSRFPKTRIIVMGSDIRDERYSSYITENNCPCLAKPFRRADVLTLSDKVLHQSTTWHNGNKNHNPLTIN